MTVLTQNTRVLSYLRSGAELTPALAWRDMGIYRLSARIKELRYAGHDIRTRMVKNGNATHAVYSLNAAAQVLASSGPDLGRETVSAVGSIPSPASAAPLASEGAG